MNGRCQWLLMQLTAALVAYGCNNEDLAGAMIDANQVQTPLTSLGKMGLAHLKRAIGDRSNPRIRRYPLQLSTPHQAETKRTWQFWCENTGKTWWVSCTFVEDVFHLVFCMDGRGSGAIVLQDEARRCGFIW